MKTQTTYEVQQYHDSWFDGEWEVLSTHRAKGPALIALMKRKRDAVCPENFRVVLRSGA